MPKDLGKTQYNVSQKLTLDKVQDEHIKGPCITEKPSEIFGLVFVVSLFYTNLFIHGMCQVHKITALISVIRVN